MDLVNPIAHAGDPSTSAEAADAVTASGKRQRNAERVLALVVKFPGMTAAELHALQGEFELQEVRRRCTDLLHAGRVVQGAARPCRVRGTRMVTWTVRAKSDAAA